MRKLTPLILSIVAVLGFAEQGACKPAASAPLADSGPAAPAGPGCVNQIEQVPNEFRVHIPEYTEPIYQASPPVSGQHYAIWARWQIHTEPLLRGYWVHNLEHGGVIFQYRPDAPQEIIDALVRVYNALPNDDSGEQACTHPRAVLTPAPLLDTAWAVVVSGPETSEEQLGVGYRIKADCIQSEQALIDFAVTYRNHSAESLCDEGFIPPDGSAAK
ncbi:MAG TPA: DUF3105 domain-containing protein [Myxococcaceae bacterium]|nr:DUF3105 domain-containing protein [Myxococcaceae bacterium]